ncbi:putative chromatin regulator PHD family [Arabidopsis thaliana]
MSSTDVEGYTFPFHDHPLSYVVRAVEHCLLCSRPSRRSSNIYYHCKECDAYMHEECVGHLLCQPFMCNHVLKVFFDTILSPLDSITDNCCYLCRDELWRWFARCTICNISMDVRCLAKRQPLTISEPKNHKHSLTLLFRLVTFTCNACGVEDDRNPYVCLECNLMVHKDCIEYLPRVISINRHDHRISHTFHLGQGEGDKECGVCRKTINWVYGGYQCSRCPSYAVHSRCATRREVWDGLELEDVPEEEEEIEDPFKVINEKGDIVHFCHEKHILRLDENYVTDDAYMQCRCCILAINGDPCYKCVECDFILHEACANLPRKKRHLLHNHKLTLLSTLDPYIKCRACGVYTDGFIYKCLHEDCEGTNFEYDVRCSSVSEPFHHDLHQHPLYFTLQSSRKCQICDIKISDNPLSCKHRCDDHFLSLCQGSSVYDTGDLWCDICETKTNPSLCYYTCDECGLSLHTNCVLGSLHYMKLGIPKPDVEIHPNNGATRPFCTGCNFRCQSTFFIRITKEESTYYSCSIYCHVWAKSTYPNSCFSFNIYPPSY